MIKKLLIAASLLLTISTSFANTTIPHTTTDRWCLADNIYFEARGEGARGMLAVAYVTVNRMLHKQYPDTICGVVLQQYKNICQFSWVCTNGLSVDRSSELYLKVLEVADYVLNSYNPKKDPTHGALMFHSKDVEPRWKSSYLMTVQIKDHLFYRPSQLNR